MEFILGLVVIIVLLLILGFGPDIIIFGVISLLVLMTVLTELFFLYCIVRLIFSKRKNAVFTRIGKRDKDRYETAFYMADGVELPNIFPCEVVMRKRLYDPDKQIKVRVDAGRKFVYDRNAVLTILFGALLGALMCVLFGGGMLLMFAHYP